MAFDLRPLTADDRTQIPQLMADAFGRGRVAQPPSPEDAQKPQSLILGIFDGSRLVAAGTIHDVTLTWGESSLRMGGLGGVACVVDHRGRGHVARLLKESLVGMRSAGQPLSGLYPFSYAFYRRHGWEWVGEKRRYTVPLAEIASHPEGEFATLVAVDDALADIKDCYARFTERYHGMTDRQAPNPNWWNGLNDRDGRRTYVYVYRDPKTGRADGYLNFRFPEEGGDTGTVGDFFANAPEAYRGLLSILHYYGTQVKKATWTAPVDDILTVHVMHHDLQSIAVPLFMGRVVDVAAAFEQIVVAGDIEGRVVVEIDDPICEWNSGTFALDAEGGRVGVKRAGGEEAGVRLDIQTLSQAFWGQPSLSILRRAGKVDVVDESQFRLLSEILPSTVCYLQDFF